VAPGVIARKRLWRVDTLLSSSPNLPTMVADHGECRANVM
jgi:hypothetical protein